MNKGESTLTGNFSDNTSSLEEILIKNKEDSITEAPWGAAKGMEVVQWKK